MGGISCIHPKTLTKFARRPSRSSKRKTQDTSSSLCTPTYFISNVRPHLRRPAHWERLLNRQTLSAQAKALESLLCKATKHSVPYVAIRRPPNWPKELSNMDETIKTCTKPVRFQMLVHQRNMLLKTIATEKWKQQCSKLSASDSVSWKITTSVFTPKPLSSPVMKRDDVVLSRKQHAEVLINLYPSKSTKHPSAPPMCLSNGPPLTPFPPISMGELVTAIAELNFGTAPGPDNIHSESIAQLPYQGRRHLLTLFNRSLLKGRLPIQ